MGQQPSAMHVARIRGRHVDRQGRRRDYESRYLRRTYRDGGKVKHETLANLSGLPALLGPAGRPRDLALALVVSRVVAPASKLSTLAWWDDVTLGADLGVAG